MGLGSGIRDPGYGKNLFRIRIPGSKRHRIPDPDPQNCGSEIKMSTHLYSGFSRVLYWRATTEPSGVIPASSLSTTVPLLLAGSSSCSPCSSLSPSTGSRTPLIKSAVSEVSSRTPSRSAGKSAAARLAAAPSRGCPAAAAMSAAESVRRHLGGLVTSVIVASANRRFSCLKKKKKYM